MLRLSTLPQLRVLANPLRLRLLQAFVAAPRTTMQVARELGEKAPKLYRHVEALHRAGLIQARGERQNRGTTERYYQAVAARFEADPSLFARRGGGASRDFAGVVSRLLRSAEQALVAAEAAGSSPGDPEGIMMAGFSVSGSPAQLRRLRRRLEAWLRDCEKTAGTGATWQGLVAWYPVAS